jgi:cobalt/nickel transport system permease protein
VNGFIFLFWVMLPFTHPGEILFTFGPLTATRDGILLAAVITLKSNAIILALLAFLSTMQIMTMGRAMRDIRIPPKLVYLLYFTFRYIDTIQREYQRQVNAIKIRGFQPGTNMHTYRTYAFLLGMLLVKSYHRAERVRAAMLCRGFEGRFYELTEFSMRPRDLVAMIMILLGVSVIGLLQWSDTIQKITS